MEHSAAALEQKLNEIAAGVPGTIGYYVGELSGTAICSRLADEQFPQASAIKIPILMEVIAQREAGKVDWNHRITIGKDNQTPGSGVLLELSDGGSALSVGDLCVLMIVLSDNTATNLLINLVGQEAVNQQMAQLGFPKTQLLRLMMDAEAMERGIQNLSTPREAGGIMRLLAQGGYLSQSLSDEILAILRKPKQTSIRAGIPPEIPLVCKPGEIPGIVTEWALVELPHRPYLLILMGKEGNEVKFSAAFTEMSRAVHEFMMASP